jgi:hypothetical protein
VQTLLRSGKLIGRLREERGLDMLAPMSTKAELGLGAENVPSIMRSEIPLLIGLKKNSAQIQTITIILRGIFGFSMAA